MVTYSSSRSGVSWAGLTLRIKLNKKCNRGGVSRLVAGPAAGSYCYLLDSYRADGAQPNIGAHQVGTIINGIPLFKVPSSIIPNNRMLSVG